MSINSKKANNVSLDYVLQKNEEYQTTILGIKAFSKTITDYFTNKFGKSLKWYLSIGRRMDTSQKNKIQPSNSVTPDIVLQIQNMGFITEIKRSMPRNEEDRWRSTVDQLEKYDDNLIGWWTDDELIDEIRLSMLIDSDSSVEFSRYIQALIENQEIKDFTLPTSIIEFYKKQEVKQFLHLRKIRGEFGISELDNIFDIGKSISVEKLLNNLKFYDHEPDCVEYTMVILWQNIFNEKQTTSAYSDEEKAWLINVNVDELTNDVQRLYGQNTQKPRDCTFPRKKWIQDALDAFVTLNLADRINTETYLIKFRTKFRVDLFQKFHSHRIFNGSKVVAAENQLPLFIKDS